ncbi:MAG: hypothetical protein [Mu-like cryoconite phage AB09]|nr:MAG: hypothetical protein [Mu-like cryoconite phage AB09]
MSHNGWANYQTWCAWVAIVNVERVYAVAVKDPSTRNLNELILSELNYFPEFVSFDFEAINFKEIQNELIKSERKDAYGEEWEHA